MNYTGPSIHASAVKVGDKAVLIRGPSGSGKSRLALGLILAGRAGQIAATTLIGDDRLFLKAEGGAPSIAAVPELAGLLEVRGLGIRRCDYVPVAEIGLVVDLDAADGDRLPSEAAITIYFGDHALPRIPVPPGFDPLPVVLAALTTTAG